MKSFDFINTSVFEHKALFIDYKTFIKLFQFRDHLFIFIEPFSKIILFYNFLAYASKCMATITANKMFTDN